MRVCLIQCDPTKGRANLEPLRHILASQPAELYVLPELFTCGYPPPPGEMPDEFIAGRLYPQVERCRALQPASSIVYGFWQSDNGVWRNSAAVLAAKGAAEVYHQVYPASASLFHVIPGRWRAIHVGSPAFANLRKIGLMICSDYNGADEAFEYYSENGVDAIVLIADSAARNWSKTFPALCGRYRVPAIVCNAPGFVGGDKGRSCVIASDGQILRELPEFESYDLIDLPMLRCKPT